MAHRDGDVDYSGFSDEELREAHEGIDPARYPVNFRNLLDEMAARGVPPPDPPTNESLIRGIVAFAILALMACVFQFGYVRFPDAPIGPCGVDRYCGKQGQPHTADAFTSYRRWERTMFVVWPVGMLAIFVVRRLRRTPRHPAGKTA
jgi:hypothetical protein